MISLFIIHWVYLSWLTTTPNIRKLYHKEAHDINKFIHLYILHNLKHQDDILTCNQVFSFYWEYDSFVTISVLLVISKLKENYIYFT